MSFTYTVPKRKTNRITYRITGSIFFLVAFCQFILVAMGYGNYKILALIFALFLGSYGIYLISASFRKQAFDITYQFNDDGLKVIHHYGETQYSFEQIEFVTMVIADENMMFYVLNVKTTKDVYSIPFTMKGELCEKIYEFVNSRIKHDDDES
ncbi:MAG: hypothetical protein E7263_05755 [Lachnospiraceae bacterium]|nr:hypothetical protein [Lachnospiraceae bacterium]